LLVAGLLGGCVTPEPTAGDAPGAATLRRDLEGLRGELGQIRGELEVTRRGAVLHADRRAIEVRSELEAVHAAAQASTRDLEQRRVETLEATDRRLGRLERRVDELAESIRSLGDAVRALADRITQLEAPPRPPRRR
jgi:chromosome segregation ATPase